jgi:hypothetical protein
VGGIPDSAIDVYRDMAQGSAQINPLSDFFQETETNMKSGKPVFEGDGFNVGYGLPAFPFDAPDTYDYTKDAMYVYPSAS